MANISGIRSNLPDGDLFPAALKDAVVNALGDGDGGATAALQELGKDLASLDAEPVAKGFINNSSTRVTYALSGDREDGSAGRIDLRGSNLPVFKPRTGEFAVDNESEQTVVSALSYSSPGRDGSRFAVEGELTVVPYRIQGERETYGIINIRSIEFRSADLRVRLSGDVTVTGRPDVVRNGERQSRDDKVTGQLDRLTIDLRDDDGRFMTARLDFRLEPGGVSRIDRISVKKDGDPGFPGFSATDLDLFFNDDGEVSTSSGRALGGSDSEAIFRGSDVITGSNEDDGIGGYGGHDRIRGLTGSDTLVGGKGDDTLEGGGGSDTLSGETGRDRLTGGAGADTFAFDTAPGNTNLDTITDFSGAQGDLLAFDLDVFGGIASPAGGTLDAGEFASGAGRKTASDAGTRIIYDTSSGTLYYDADGAGGTGAVRVALIGGKPVLEAADLFIFAGALPGK